MKTRERQRHHDAACGGRPRRRTVLAFGATTGLATMAGLGCGPASESTLPAAPHEPPAADARQLRHLRHRRAALLQQQRAAFTTSESSFFSDAGDVASTPCHCTSPFQRRT